MVSRVKLALGDIFEIHLEGDKKGYFQYIAKDSTQLDSEVVRIFSNRYSIAEEPNFSDIVSNGVQLHAHVFIKTGLRFGFWNKVGNEKIDESIVLSKFRATDDILDPSIKISKKWYVWEINQKSKYVGKLNAEQKQYTIGVVQPPQVIKKMMETGENAFTYPSS